MILQEIENEKLFIYWTQYVTISCLFVKIDKYNNYDYRCNARNIAHDSNLKIVRIK